MYSGLLVALGFLVSHAVVQANPLQKRAPSVAIDSATVNGITTGRVNRFLGIPFAKPPIGDRRFRKPEAVDPYTGTIQATAFGPACPQQDFDLPFPPGIPDDTLNFITNTVWKLGIPDSEDCLTLNVIAPSSATPASKLPVVVWIFGGGFQIGSTTQYDGGVLVERSIQIGQPTIYVSMNYRLTAFGFLASKEVKDAGVANLGLHDQREALRWIQKYIGSFGGDPTKVTIWGESAGAVSASLHMIANDGNTEGLFRGAIMQSGSPVPVGDVTKAQQHYDNLVENTECSGESDTLECLRHVPYDILKAAVDQTPSITAYNTLVLPWLPRTDGTFIKEDAQKLVQQGKIANIPYITGDCDDEGTLFSLVLYNITTTSQLKTYLKEYYLPDGTDAELDQVLSLYPVDITQGSPYDTSIFNAITPQFKRIASILGDVVFQASRRLFLDHSPSANTWVYLSKRLKATPFLGSFHASDLLNSYGGGELTDYIIRFTNNLDPNGGSRPNWPKYDSSSRQLLTFMDSPLTPTTITRDTYRQSGIDFLTNLMLQHPI